MQTVDVNHATTCLGELVNAAVQGETIVIRNEQQQAVRLVPVATPPARPHFGSARGLFEMRDDFDDPLPEFEDDG